jgi:hypothetical protein
MNLYNKIHEVVPEAKENRDYQVIVEMNGS